MATATKQTVTFPANEYEVVPVVIVTSDVDCDGIGYGYHRVLVPRSLDRSLAGAYWFAIQTEQMSGYGDACEILQMERFTERVYPEWDERDRAYFDEAGYHGVFYARGW